MAYNLQPLITLLQQILDPEQKRWILDHKKPELESLLEKTASLQQILEKSSPTQIESLESRIRITAHKADDLIESYMVNRMLSSPTSVRFCFSKLDLRQATKEFDSLLKFIKGKTAFNGGPSRDPTPDLQLVDGKKMAVSSKTDLVGVDADLLKLKDRLTNTESRLEIIPIVGMGGIVKSALALNLYEDSLILSHFDYRGWAAISQVYNMRAILLSLLRPPNGKVSNELIGLEDSELKDKLYKKLFGRRYMIVLDDMWSNELWDEIRRYLPDNSNGSRIVITTRELDVAKYANWCMQHHAQLLNKSASWDLLCQIVFGEEDCPHELQEMGTKIAIDCCGLPLAIQVIGGLLSKVERARDVWEHISADVKAALVESDEQFSNILSLSYNHLPIHLKPCFLYMGAFLEDYMIKGSRLINILVAEGFVKSNGDKSLEEEAEDYLKALVERNLILVPRKKSNGKPMSYSIHDLMRDLCIRKADEEKFLHVKNFRNDATFSNQRRVSVQSSYGMEDVCASPQLISLARSLICTEKKKKILSPIFPMLRLVRVLDVMKIVFEEFPEEILQLVNLRYIAFSCNSGLPIGISRLWNLQTLISREVGDFVSSEILEISELRHLRLDTLIKIEEGYEIKFVHKKLQTIYLVQITPSLIRSGFFRIIPNIKTLGIYYIDSPNIEVDLNPLHKLEKLRCASKLDVDGSRFLPNVRFPCNLRKLTLVDCLIFWNFCTTLSALPNLESLKIFDSVFESEKADEDAEWEVPDEDEFCSLQFLHLGTLNIVRWRANETNFPRLRRLVIRECNELEEIPSAIGDIPTLQQISICECSASVVASAQEIERVQQDEYDNYDLQLYIE